MAHTKRGRSELTERQVLLVREALSDLVEECGGDKHGSRKKLAERLGVSGSAVTQWLSAKNAPSFETATAVAKAKGVSVAHLLEIDLEPEAHPDPYPNRARAIALARQAGVDERASERVRARPGAKSDHDRPVQVWLEMILAESRYLDETTPKPPPVGRELIPEGPLPRPPRDRKRPKGF